MQKKIMHLKVSPRGKFIFQWLDANFDGFRRNNSIFIGVKSLAFKNYHP